MMKEPLFTQDGRGTESFGLFRNDNGQWLGAVGARYEVMQNATLAEMMIEASAGVDLEITRGGHLAGGRRIYLQAGLPDEYIGKSGVKRFITALNSHDGSTSIAFGSTNTVVVCQNTFYKAFRSAQMNKYRHTANAEQRLREAVADLRAALDAEAGMIANFHRMADTRLTDEAAEGILSKILKKSFNVDLNGKKDDLSTRKKNQLNALNTSIERELRDEGATLWGLFNGVTRYTNHTAAPKDDKLDYLMTGTGASINGTAYDEIMTWINANTADPILVPVR